MAADDLEHGIAIEVCDRQIEGYAVGDLAHHMAGPSRRRRSRGGVFQPQDGGRRGDQAHGGQRRLDEDCVGVPVAVDVPGWAIAHEGLAAGRAGQLDACVGAGRACRRARAQVGPQPDRVRPQPRAAEDVQAGVAVEVG